MTESAVRKALADSIEETLEMMFFLSCLGEPDQNCPLHSEMGAQVAFEGAARGRLTVVLPVEAAHSIAADFLGEEGDVPERNVGEVLCEMANMICGSALSRIGNTGEFRLSEPRLLESLEPNGGWRGIAHHVETGRGVLRAILEMEELACPPAKKRAS